ncbi:hemolysin III family protein [Marinobacteraceae bacterium S3BR75-40.1]
MRRQETFNFYSHLAGMVLAVVGMVVLLVHAASSPSLMLTALVYGLSVVFLFSASSLYHAFKTQENELSFWRKLDRLAIFAMIAGTYTPVCYFFLDDAWRVPMIALQWGLVALGVFTQIFFPRAPRMLYAVIYLIMGWLLVLPIRQVLDAMTVLQVTLLFAGGAAFTLGALFYAFKRPLLKPGVFSFHELFHVMVLLGAGSHYALVYDAFSNFQAVNG